MFHVPEKYRVLIGKFASSKSDENNGTFFIPFNLKKTLYANIIVSDGVGWEHLSIHLSYRNGIDVKRTPTWEEMCKIKDMFWDEHDCVIQYHPPKSDYVNQHKYCLHLWNPIDYVIPIPNPLLVGSK